MIILALVVAWLGSTVALVVVVVGMIRSRTYVHLYDEDKPACPNCGYCVYGLPSPVCPECGAELPAKVLSGQGKHTPPARRRRLARWTALVLWASLTSYIVYRLSAFTPPSPVVVPNALQLDSKSGSYSLMVQVPQVSSDQSDVPASIRFTSGPALLRISIRDSRLIEAESGMPSANDWEVGRPITASDICCWLGETGVEQMIAHQEQAASDLLVLMQRLREGVTLEQAGHGLARFRPEKVVVLTRGQIGRRQSSWLPWMIGTFASWLAGAVLIWKGEARQVRFHC